MNSDQITPWYVVANEHEIPSPALLIYLERVESNLREMLTIAGNPDRLRPHIKTHKIPELIRLQLDMGIWKFKCATIAEAEMAAAEGARDVLIAFPLVGPNAARLRELRVKFPETQFSAVVDNPEGLAILAEEALIEEQLLPVYLDIDCGMHRTGVPADSEMALDLYRRLSRTPGIEAAGLHCYDGHLHQPDAAERKRACEEAFVPVETLRRAIVAQGLPAPQIIAGGTPTFEIHAQHPNRELSPGTSVLWDFGYGDMLSDLPFVPAAVVLTRVISKPGHNRLCLDLGHKAIAAENPHPRVRLLEIPDAAAVIHSEEHLVIETPEADRFPVGRQLHGIPRHVCPTVALYDRAWVVSEGVASQTWKITARARHLTV
jgi:D-serine deaminase-like pyridoxal phosphate-dependent protein